jgi:ribonuclease R
MRRALPSRSAVLGVFRDEERPIELSDIADTLGVEPGSYPGLLRLLDDLVFDGVLSARGDKFKLEKKSGFRTNDAVLKGLPDKGEPAAKRSAGVLPSTPDKLPAPAPTKSPAGRKGRERREGVLTVNPRGFGFVASPTASGDDVFVGADSLGGAMHGDHVIVEIVTRGTRGAEGQIVEVTRRGVTRVSGILRRKGKNAWIELDDPRVRGPVVLTRDVDRAGPEGNSGQDGQVVVAEITRFPDEPGENPEGKLVAVLGRPGELAV